MSNSLLLSVNRANFGYGHKVLAPVVEDVCLEVHAGEMVLLVGPNGSGKSTIMKAITGQGALYEGDVELRVAPSEVSYIPQELPIEHSLPVTAYDVVRSAFAFSGALGRGGATKQAVCNAIANVGLEDSRIHKHYGSLSGGQRRLVLLARALVTKPRLLILDEPTANVDVLRKGQMEEVLVKQMQKGLGILAASHALGWVHTARRVSLVKEFANV